MNTINDLANWFLSKSSMEHKKLQKLCYYAVAWHYALYDSPLVDDDRFEAWVHGPVSPSLWFTYKDYGWYPIPMFKEGVDFDETEEFLEIVYNTYGEFTGHQLESLTHTEEPWLEARGDLEEYKSSKAEINTDTMRDFYKELYQNSQND